MSSNLSVNRVCEYCKNTFVAKTTRTRFCSPICNGRNNKMIIRNLKIKESDLDTIVAKYQETIPIVNYEDLLPISIILME